MSSIRTAAAQNAIAAISIRDGAGLHTVKVATLRDSGSASRQVFGAGGTASNLTPSFVRGAGYSAGIIRVTTDQATISGVDSSSTVVWHFDDAGWEATNPGSPVSAFNMSVGPGDSQTTKVSATVTKGASSYTTNKITATVINTYG